jgi:DNA adenine methylase
MKETLKAPMPWFGGKSRVAKAIWERFGNTQNFVDPFCGSLSVLLSRPTPPGAETVNDANGFLTCFWRAVRDDPAAVAHWADYPVSEVDLHARHRWLLAQAAALKERMLADPDYFDAKIAGWWVWGACCWIGSGWCVAPHAKLPHLGDAGMGEPVGLPPLKRPQLGRGGCGVHRWFQDQGGPTAGETLTRYLASLAERLRRVRICCGDWTRVLGPSPTTKHGLTAVLLDPPYGADRTADLYAEDSADVAGAVREWALAHGDDPLLRIALCGYEDEHRMPRSWEVLRWKAPGGYGNQGNGTGRANAKRETLWFSPHCERPDLRFDWGDDEETP